MRRLVGMPIGGNAGAAGTGHDRNRSTDAITLSTLSTVVDAMSRTAIGMCVMCVGGGLKLCVNPSISQKYSRKWL